MIYRLTDVDSFACNLKTDLVNRYFSSVTQSDYIVYHYIITLFVLYLCIHFDHCIFLSLKMYICLFTNCLFDMSKMIILLYNRMETYRQLSVPRYFTLRSILNSEPNISETEINLEKM